MAGFLFVCCFNIYIKCKYIDQYGSISIYKKQCGVQKVDGVANRVRCKM